MKLSTSRAHEIVNALNLRPHPEGGFYRETYRSSFKIAQSCLPEGYSGERSISTAILYLHTPGHFLAFHRINQDELWHFHEGGAIDFHIISVTGEFRQARLGHRYAAGEVPQVMVPGGSWFASGIADADEGYALAGCTVAPGFDFMDFDLIERAELINMFPERESIITQFTR